MEFRIFGDKASQWMEAEILRTRFLLELRGTHEEFARDLYAMTARTPRKDILTWLPYWLTNNTMERFSFNALRSISLGNQFGTAYFLIQDKYSDFQTPNDSATGDGRLLIFSSILYNKWLCQYQKVFGLEHPFWLYFEKHLHEYVNSTIWEKNEHWGRPKTFPDSDLVHLGKKLSPLKQSAVGVYLLGGRPDLVSMASDMIELYHIGYQLADDVADWPLDHASRNYTYLLSMVYAMTGRDHMNSKEVEEVLAESSVVEHVLEKSSSYLQQAKTIAEALQSPLMTQYVDSQILRNQVTGNEVSGKQKQPRPHTKAWSSDRVLRIADVHTFSLAGRNFVFDVRTRSSSRVDDLGLKVIRRLQEGPMSVKDLFSKITGHDQGELPGVIDELDSVHLLAGQAEERTGHREKEGSVSEAITAVCVQVNSKTDLDKTIPLNIATQAIDLVFRHGHPSIGSTVSFLLASVNHEGIALIDRVSMYANNLAEKLRRSVNFLLFLNGNNLNPRDQEMVGSSGSVRDVVIEFPFGAVSNGSMEKLSTFLGKLRTSGKNVRLDIDLNESADELDAFIDTVRRAGCENVMLTHTGTLNEEHVKLVCGTCSQWLVKSPIRLGNLFRPIERAHKSVQHFCNAGKSYLGVGIDGSIFPCHRLIGCSELRIGTVDGPIDQQRFLNRRFSNIENCSKCWARNICSGGCIAEFFRSTGSTDSPAPTWCDMFRRQLELGISARFQIDESEIEAHKELARKDVRVCDLM